MKNIDEIIGKIQEKWGHQTVQSARHFSTEKRTYPSGFLALDGLVGSIPRGYVTEFVGRPSSGVTTLAYHSLALAQKQEANIVVIDSIGNLDMNAATRHRGANFYHLESHFEPVLEYHSFSLGRVGC